MSNYHSTEETLYVERVFCNYTPLQKKVMLLQKQNILNELEILTLNGISLIYKNQEDIASKVVSSFKDRKIINTMVISKTQSGKTGSMCATIKKYLEEPNNIIPIENIYIITGLSSCEWKEQTKERIPLSIGPRIFHRCELPSTFVDEIKDKKNVLIIMDEIQVAAKKGQTIYNTFQAANMLDKHRLYEHDIKILEYTATPDGTIYDLMKWKDASCKILAEVGNGYISSYDLLQKNRVKQYHDLCGYNKTTGEMDESVLDHIKEIKADIINFTTPKWHIIRTKNGIYQEKTIENFRIIFNNKYYRFVMYDGESEIEDINKSLYRKPEQHTFIFIKEMLRCAKTLVKTHLGVLYERHSHHPDDAVIIQGLIGRLSGHGDNSESICYTNVESIKKYEKLWLSEFEDTTIRWHSKTTKYAYGTLTGKHTFNDPKDYDGFSVSSDEGEEEKPEEPVIQKCKSQEEAKEYYKTQKERFGGRGPNKRKPNKNGYYEATIRSVPKIYSCEAIHLERRQGLTKTNFRLYPCYKNVEDKDTLEWWFIHY